MLDGLVVGWMDCSHVGYIDCRLDGLVVGWMDWLYVGWIGCR